MANSYFDGSINNTCGIGPYGGCLGDIDGDGAQTVEDMLFMLANFGSMGPNAADLNVDELVGAADLLILRASSGATALSKSISSAVRASPTVKTLPSTTTSSSSFRVLRAAFTAS